MGFLDLFNKKFDGDDVSFTFRGGIDIPKMDWDEFLKFIGYTNEDVKGNVGQLKTILSPFLVDLYKYKYNMPIDLNKRIDMFYQWFENDRFRGCYHADIKELISKVVSWYEMRYSDSALKEMLSSGRIDVFNCFNFDSNDYIKQNFSDDSDVYYLELSKTLDFRFFIKSLSDDEREIFKKKKLSVHFTKDDVNTYFLTPNGFVDSVYDNKDSSLYKKCDKTTHVTDALDFNNSSIDIYINASKERVKSSIMYCYKSAFVRQQILNCSMYQLLLNHNTEFGAFRSLLFAKEFGLDIDIPMIYGATRDRYVRKLIIFYLKFGGSKDLACYSNYFDDGYQRGNSPLEFTSVSSMIKCCRDLYTREEKYFYQKLVDVLASKVSSSKDLYQKLVDVLASQINREELAMKKEEKSERLDDERRRRVIQKRLEKKLNR